MKPFKAAAPFSKPAWGIAVMSLTVGWGVFMLTDQTEKEPGVAVKPEKLPAATAKTSELVSAMPRTLVTLESSGR